MSYIFYDYDHHIYTLIDPFSNEVFYVGRSINPENRFIQHLKYPKNINLKNRIDSIIKKGSKPVMNIVQVCKKDVAIERELYWINKFAQQFNLTNRRVGRTPNYYQQDVGIHCNEYYRNFSNKI